MGGGDSRRILHPTRWQAPTAGCPRLPKTLPHTSNLMQNIDSTASRRHKRSRWVSRPTLGQIICGEKHDAVGLILDRGKKKGKAYPPIFCSLFLSFCQQSSPRVALPQSRLCSPPLGLHSVPAPDGIYVLPSAFPGDISHFWLLTPPSCILIPL